MDEKISEKEKHKKPVEGLEGDITKPHLKQMYNVVDVRQRQAEDRKPYGGRKTRRHQ